MPSRPDFESLFKNPPPLLLRLTLAGALGGWLGFLGGELVFPRSDALAPPEPLQIIGQSALWMAVVGVCLGLILIFADNAFSLRGKWHRDADRGALLLAVLSFLSGAMGQIFYAGAMGLVGGIAVFESLARAFGWSILGAGVGAAIGFARREEKVALRGFIGGTAGGFLGGFLFDAIAAFLPGGDGIISRAFGLVLTGAAIGFCLALAQEALKSAWLLGVSTGPYEGRESPLDKERVSVGRASDCDLILWRDEGVGARLGEFVHRGGVWYWDGERVEIDGTPQTFSPLTPGATLQLGTYKFRFQTRERLAPIPPANVMNAPVEKVPQPLVLEPLDVRFSPFVIQNSGQNLGRAPGSDFVVADATVSSSHAQFVQTRGFWSVRDLDSTNGTHLNGVRVQEQSPSLKPGDELRFGAVKFRVGSS